MTAAQIHVALTDLNRKIDEYAKSIELLRPGSNLHKQTLKTYHELLIKRAAMLAALEAEAAQ